MYICVICTYIYGLTSMEFFIIFSKQIESLSSPLVIWPHLDGFVCVCVCTAFSV